MEDTSKVANIDVTTGDVTIGKDTMMKLEDQIIDSPTSFTKKKKKGPMNFFKVALYMWRHKPIKPEIVTEDKPTNDTWKRVVGSMRPLHLDGNTDSPIENSTNSVSSLPKVVTDYNEPWLEEVFTPPRSPGFYSYTDSVGSSRYASALNLQELDDTNNEEENEKVTKYYENQVADEMIDAKADQFIAQFYAQMKIQNKVLSQIPEY